MYLAFGAGHAPHHAPRRWLDHYSGQFDDGWDAWRERNLHAKSREGIIAPGTVLSPRPSWVPAWDSLSRPDQVVAARLMEAFAAFISMPMSSWVDCWTTSRQLPMGTAPW